MNLTRTEVELIAYLLGACAAIYYVGCLLFQIHTNAKAMRRRLEAQAGMAAEPDYGRVTPPNPALHFSGLSDLKASEQRDQIRVLREQMNEGRSPDGDGHVLESRSGHQGIRIRRDWSDGARTASGRAGDGADPKGGVDVSAKQTRAGSEPADPHTILPFKGYAFQFRPGGR